VQWVGVPLQLAQDASQAAQIRSAAAEQLAVMNWPAGHAPEQATHIPFAR
jgi:hypothetical protein